MMTATQRFNLKYPGRCTATARKWNKENADRKRNNDRKYLERHPAIKALWNLRNECKRVGITVEFYNSLPKKCFNKKCGNIVDLHKDHDHKTGKFRGLLCGGCNKALGFIKDDVARLQGLIDYLGA